MTKAKSPAFLFYTGDFTTGTQFFSDEQVGKYIRLLLAQHQTGHLTEKQMLFICKSYDEDIFSKFTKDADNKFFNERLEIEIQKRENYVSSRSNNKSGRKQTKENHKTIKSKSYDKHMLLHMENENEIEKVIDNKEQGLFEKTFADFIEMRKKMKKAPTDKALELIKLELNKLAPDNEAVQIEIIKQSIISGWSGVFPLRQEHQMKKGLKENGVPVPSMQELKGTGVYGNKL